MTNKREPLRYLSVCSGIEAATVAWHPLGWEPLAFSELAKFPRKVLAHHYPDVPLHGDFTLLRDQPWIAGADVLVGGTPCQSFSVAGLRGGLSDSRGNLTLEFVRLANAIDDLRPASSPATILWENVPGVLSSRDNAFGALLAGLGGCDAPSSTQDRGRAQVWLLGPGASSLGGYSMPNSLEWPSVADVSLSSLSDVLHTATDGLPLTRYFLSVKACRGILSRAERRGKPLPEALRVAVEVGAK